MAERSDFPTGPAGLVRPPGPGDLCFFEFSAENAFCDFIEGSVDLDLFPQGLFDKAHVVASSVERLPIDMFRPYSFEAMNQVDQIRLEVGADPSRRKDRCQDDPDFEPAFLGLP